MIVSQNKNNINYFKVMTNIINGDRGDDIVKTIYSNVIIGSYGKNYGLNSDYNFYFNTSTLSFYSSSDGSLREIKIVYDTKNLDSLFHNGVVDMKEFKESILESILVSQSEYLKIVNFNDDTGEKVNELILRRNYSLDMLTKDEQLLVILSIVGSLNEDLHLDDFRHNVYYNNSRDFNNTVISFINANPEMFFAGLDGFHEISRKMFFKNFFNQSYYQYTEKVRAMAKEKK